MSKLYLREMDDISAVYCVYCMCTPVLKNYSEFINHSLTTEEDKLLQKMNIEFEMSTFDIYLPACRLPS